MEIKRVYALYFSPTGGTKLVTERIAALFGNFESVDITVNVTAPAFGEGDLVVVGMPVYGGRIPAPAAYRLAELSGNGALSLPIAVFGNRAVDDALLELRNLLVARSFKCVAAGEFVVRHSLAPQFGKGRPDASDLAVMERLAERLRTRLENALTADSLPSVIVPGNTPYREYNGVPLKPSVKKARCIKCGKCAAECPVGAISRNDPTKTDAAKCISCMRCASVCPQFARGLSPVMELAAKQGLRKLCSGRADSKLYL